MANLGGQAEEAHEFETMIKQSVDEAAPKPKPTKGAKLKASGDKPGPLEAAPPSKKGRS